MTIKQLKAFLSVASTLSFAQASQRMHITQSALSLTIQSLEEVLGGKLFTRTTRQVRLTQEGEKFLPLASRIIADLENIQEEMKQRFELQKGIVTLASMPTFAANHLPDMLLRFHRQFPNVHIRVHDVINEQVVTMVENGSVEIGIVFEPDNIEHLDFIPLFIDTLVAIVPPDSELAEKEQLTWDMLSPYPFISLQRPSSFRAMIEDSLEKQGRSLDVMIESQQLSTIGKMVSCGLGVSVVPQLCMTQMEAVGAVCLPISSPCISSNVGIVTRDPEGLSIAAKSLLTVMKAHTFPFVSK